MSYFDTNLVVISGNLGEDPNYSFTSEKKDFAYFDLAVNKRWEEEGKERSRTDWFQIILDKHNARFAKDYLSKGSKVQIEGELRTNVWIDDKSIKHKTIQIFAHKIKSLDKPALPENASNNAKCASNKKVMG